MKTQKPHKYFYNIFICIVTALALVLGITGCSSASTVPEVLRIPYYGTAQSEILAYLLKDVLEQDGYEARIVEVSSYKDIQPAMMGDTLDLFIDYTSRGWLDVLNQGDLYKPEYLPQLLEAYKNLGLEWISIPSLTASYTLAVRQNIIEEYDLKTLSDLAEVSGQLILGADASFFERKEGYPLLQKGYGIDFGTTKNLPEDLQYAALKNKQIDVMPVYTTDGRLPAGKMSVLEDDLDLLADFTAGIVMRQAVSDKYPEMPSQLQKALENLTAPDLMEVNAMVVQNGVSADRAAAFLLEKITS